MERTLRRPPPGKYSTKRKKHEPEKPVKGEKVRTRKARVIEAFKNRNKIRLKDKYGNNVKQHFGIWKYFINTSTASKEKFYISLDCYKYNNRLAFEVAKRDKAARSEFFSILGKIGAKGSPEELAYWGLPLGICAKFSTLLHISKLYPWQIECLSQAAESEENLIYSVPTSGGKSLVAEVMMLRAVLCKKKRAMYVLPYISIVCEKAEYLKRLTEDINVKIEQFHGLCKFAYI